MLGIITGLMGGKGIKLLLIVIVLAAVGFTIHKAFSHYNGLIEDKARLTAKVVELQNTLATKQATINTLEKAFNTQVKKCEDYKKQREALDTNITKSKVKAKRSKESKSFSLPKIRKSGKEKSRPVTTELNTRLKDILNEINAATQTK